MLAFQQYQRLSRSMLRRRPTLLFFGESAVQRAGGLLGIPAVQELQTHRLTLSRLAQ
jgi:hypothetical protein